MKGIFDWVPWFRELSAKIVDGGEQYLIARVKAVDWGKPPALRKFGDDKIDPLSFLYFLSAHLNAIESVHKTFEIETDIPGPQARVFPQAMGFKTLFFGEGSDRSQLFWRLFRQAQPDDPELDADDLREALDIKGIGVAMLTQALCLTNAEAFLPVDGTLKPLGVPTPLLKEEFTLDEYRSIMDRMRGSFPECRLYEVGRLLYEHGTEDDGLISEKSRYFQISTNVRDDKNDEWKSFQRENAVWTGGPSSRKMKYRIDDPKRGDILLVRFGMRRGRAIGVVSENDYRSHGGWSAERRIHVLWINKKQAELSQNAAQIALSEAREKTFLAFKNTDEYRPSFDLIGQFGTTWLPNSVPVNPPQDDPIPKGPVVSHPLNQILYGPPGTGKTWNTVARAVAIADGREVKAVEEDRRESESVKDRFDGLRDAGQIAMATFHQNYAYEDFIEGIRPVLDQDGHGQVAYELGPGVLRNIATAASKNLRDSSSITNRSDVDGLITDFLEFLEDRLAAGEKVPLDVGHGKGPFFVRRVLRNSNGGLRGVDLKGPAGGRPRLAVTILRRDYWAFRDGRIQSPKDILPVHSGAAQKSGRVLHFALLRRMKQYHEEEWSPERHEPAEAKKFVLIIDEINRGNIARIFGELITLVEESRRIGGSDETKVRLPYSGDEFGVPENLYIIGTMNTADRSIALLDTALRRRFEFVEMMPQPDHEKVSDNADGVDCRRLLRAMNDRIRFLLDREHQIGHTYFLDVENIEGLKDAFQKQVVPLLQEYFYDDWAKIDAVLGGNGFVRPVPCPEELKEEGLVDADARAWELAPFKDDPWGEADAYRKIYAGKADEGTAPAGGGQPKEGAEERDG